MEPPPGSAPMKNPKTVPNAMASRDCLRSALVGSRFRMPLGTSKDRPVHLLLGVEQDLADGEQSDADGDELDAVVQRGHAEGQPLLSGEDVDADGGHQQSDAHREEALDR